MTEMRATPYMANRIRALLSNMFNFAIKWKWLADNPAFNVEKYKEHKRNRWLNEDELKRLLDSLNNYHNQNVADVIRLLLLTGSRKREVLSATWEQINLNKGVWTKPAHTTKQNKMEYMPLSRAAIDCIAQIKVANRDSIFLFPGKIPGKPLHDIKKSWATILKRAELKDVRLHDLRHTFASHLVSKGLSLSIVGKLLGHTQVGTTHRYAHLADEPLREASNIIGDTIQTLNEEMN